MASLYSMADVFVNPTIQETFGMTTAEALACGTPVVAYNGTATPELVGKDGKCGSLVNENNPKQFYEKIMEIMLCGKNSYTMACRKRTEEKFSKNTNIQEYIRLFRLLAL